MKEEWRPVVGYEGIYIISNHGRIVSIKCGRENGYKERELKPHYYPGNYLGAGYVRTILSRNGRVKGHLMHRLVYEAFNGRIPAGLEINHINGIKTDNRLENLEAVTRLENTRHAYAYLNKASTAPRGTKSGKHRLDDDSVRAMRELRRNGMPYKAIAKRFGVGYGTAFNAANGKSWKHVKAQL